MAKRTQQPGKSRTLTRRQQRARRQRWIIGGVVALVVIALAGVAYAYVTRDQPGEKFDDQGNMHLSAAPEAYVWNSRPPSSGPHAPNIAQWGEHFESVPEWQQVHNLEDGGVIMHYNCPEGCDEIVEELRDILRDNGTERLILHPYENMDSTIALTAWTRVLALDEMDRGQIQGFIDAYKGIDHHR